MSLRGKGLMRRGGKPSRPGGGRLKRFGAGLGKVARGAAGAMSGMPGRGGMHGRRRGRGITARQFSTARRVLRKIIKMYSKLPRRAATRTAGTCSRPRR